MEWDLGRIPRAGLLVLLVALLLAGSLPAATLDAAPVVLWTGDVEEGTLYDWTYDDFAYPGGGVFNTGGADVTAQATTVVAHSGSYAAEATITNAYRAQNGARAVRLMRWTDRPWDDGGDYFPLDATYSVWMYFPYTYNPNKYEPWDPGDGGWWNVFQFKSDDEAGVSQPVWALNVAHDDDADVMYFYLYSNYNTPHDYEQPAPIAIPVGQWVHVSARYVQSATGQGRIIVWQDDALLFDLPDVTTILDGPATWGIGNYTDHISGGPVEGAATLYFDDAQVTVSAGDPLPPGYYEETDSRLTYNAHWRFKAKAAASGGAAAKAKTEAQVSFSFTGDLLVIYRRIGPNEGAMAVCVADDCALVDNYRGEGEWTVPVTFGPYPGGEHQVTVSRPAGEGRFWLDAVEVIDVGARVPPLTAGVLYHDDAAQLLYMGNWITKTKPDAIGGGAAKARRPYAGVYFHFSGDTFTLYRRTGPVDGSMTVCIDGACQQVSNTSAVKLWGQPVTFSGLGAGPHLVGVYRNPGSKLWFDGVWIGPGAPPMPVE